MGQETNSFDVLWGVVTSTVISTIKGKINLSSNSIMYLNYILAGLGSFLYNWVVLNQDWKNSGAGAIVSLFSSLGWYKTVGQPLRDAHQSKKDTGG